LAFRCLVDHGRVHDQEGGLRAVPRNYFQDLRPVHYGRNRFVTAGWPTIEPEPAAFTLVVTMSAASIASDGCRLSAELEPAQRCRSVLDVFMQLEWQ
jgi:hypothetical protein